MSSSERHGGADLKVLILAAGPTARVNAPSLLRPLGEYRVIDYVIANARALVPPQDIFIVVRQGDDTLQSHLGDAYTYIVQEEQLGTGHAVWQVAAHLNHFQGDLLILYGDTPLLRAASLKGLLNRHRLKHADLTLLTALIDRPYPYGRVLRDAEGRIMDVIEVAEPKDAQGRREVNVGAYAARATVLFPALARLIRRNEPLPLTDVVHLLAREGKRVDAYRIYDPDEVLGINTPEDLEEAEFILQKRYFRPTRTLGEERIHFGTGGWRAVIGEGFTMNNVRRLCQALANQVIREGKESQGVLIGYDRRFLSDMAARAAAEVFAGNNIPVVLLPEDAPTPLITYATEVEGAAYGLAFTASHNPPEWNGLKVFHTDGSLLLVEETNRIEEEANALSIEDVVHVDLDVARDAGMVANKDFTNAYVDAVESFVDMKAIRDAGLRVVIDPMYGTGQVTLEIILTEARCRVTTLHGRHDPLFGGRSPAPDLHALGLLINTVKEGHYDLGMATDGDADRIAIVDERGEYVHINDLLLLLYYYLHEVRGERGPVVRNLATTHLLDRLAKHLGERCYETPVGFKYIAKAMKEHNALLGGESSGGLTVRGHILGKDGILAAVLVVEMIARTGRHISEMLEDIYAITGRLYTVEENVPATPAMKVYVPRRLREHPVDHIGPYPVRHISHLDGVKFLLDNDNWLLLRFSGTEPVLRIFAEADTPEKARELVDWAKRFTELQAERSTN